MSISTRIIPLSILAALAVGACRIPRIAVRQTLPIVDTMSVGGQVVKHYRARDYAARDSTDRILRLEYLPVDLFAVVDARDSVTSLFCTAWQTYLWRFSERLEPVDKQYYVPVFLSATAGDDSLNIVWGYPQLDDRDEDLKYVVRRRNEYWSVERMIQGAEPDELWAGPVKSYPQYNAYSPLGRFSGGTYARAMVDSSGVARIARTELTRFLSNDAADTTGR